MSVLLAAATLVSLSFTASDESFEELYGRLYKRLNGTQSVVYPYIVGEGNKHRIERKYSIPASIHGTTIELTLDRYERIEDDVFEYKAELVRDIKLTRESRLDFTIPFDRLDYISCREIKDAKEETYGIRMTIKNGANGIKRTGWQRDSGSYYIMETYSEGYVRKSISDRTNMDGSEPNFEVFVQATESQAESLRDLIRSMKDRAQQNRTRSLSDILLDAGITSPSDFEGKRIF